MRDMAKEEKKIKGGVSWNPLGEGRQDDNLLRHVEISVFLLTPSASKFK